MNPLTSSSSREGESPACVSSARESGSKRRRAVLPARDWLTAFESAIWWLPVRMTCPLSLVWSASTCMYERSSGTRWTSSIMTGPAWTCQRHVAIAVHPGLRNGCLRSASMLSISAERRDRDKPLRSPGFTGLHPPAAVADWERESITKAIVTRLQ